MAENNYGRTPFIRINWNAEISGYAKNPDNWIFLWEYATYALCISADTIKSIVAPPETIAQLRICPTRTDTLEMWD